MIESAIFLSIMAIGLSLITLAVVVDVTRKLTLNTREMIQQHEVTMQEMVAKHNETTKQMKTEMSDWSKDIFILQRDVAKINQHNRNEKARMKAIIAEAEKKGNTVKDLLSSKRHL